MRERPGEPWWSFLTELDTQLNEPADLHCIGGFVVIQVYGFERETADIDLLTVIPQQANPVLASLAGKGSLLHRESWGPADWQRVAEWVTLEMGVGRRSPGLEVRLAAPAKEMFLVRPEWDGRRLDPQLVRVGEGSLRLAIDVTPGIHLLRLGPEAGKLPPLGPTTLD